jgi:nitrilase
MDTTQSQKILSGLGAEIVLVPSAFTVPTGTAHWDILLRARAIENQCYVIAAAQIGSCAFLFCCFLY